MKITEKSLVSILDRSSAELKRGEKVKLNIGKKVYSLWLNLQLSGRYQNLMCVRRSNSFFLARVR